MGARGARQIQPGERGGPRKPPGGRDVGALGCRSRAKSSVPRSEDACHAITVTAAIKSTHFNQEVNN